jgi:hypothetical protein
MRSFLLAILGLALPAAGATHVLLRYLDIGEQGTVQALAADAAGNIFAAATVAHPPGGSALRVIKTDANGLPLASFEFPAAPAVAGVGGAAVDAQGNLVMVGQAYSGFPLVSSLYPPVSGNGSAAFVIKLDSQLHGILFSTLLPSPSAASAVALDAAGNILLAGGTSAANRILGLNRLVARVDARWARVFVPWAIRHPRHLAAFVRLARTHEDSKRIRARALQNGVRVPPFLILSVTSRCNLRCAGCFAVAVGTTAARHLSGHRSVCVTGTEW